jgi:hypothetical protein
MFDHCENKKQRKNKIRKSCPLLSLIFFHNFTVSWTGKKFQSENQARENKSSPASCPLTSDTDVNSQISPFRRQGLPKRTVT